MAYAKIRPRRGTKYEWETTNPILEEGEFCVECPDTGVGTGLSRFKIGDGQSHWSDLPYAFDGLSANSIFGGGVTEFSLIQLRGGTTEDWEGIDPILAENEVAVDTTLLAFKIGDGEHKWTELRYMTSAPFFGNEYEWDGILDFGDESETTLGVAIDNSMLPETLMDEGWNDHLNTEDSAMDENDPDADHTSDSTTDDENNGSDDNTENSGVEDTNNDTIHGASDETIEPEEDTVPVEEVEDAGIEEVIS